MTDRPLREILIDYIVGNSPWVHMIDYLTQRGLGREGPSKSHFSLFIVDGWVWNKDVLSGLSTEDLQALYTHVRMG